MNKINFLMEYFKYLKNPISALKLKFGIVDSCEVKIKNYDESLFIENVPILDELMWLLPAIPNSRITEFIEYFKGITNDEEFLNIEGVKYINIFNKKFIKNHPLKYNTCYGEHFTDDGWDMVDFKNRDVIDVGANVADTTLYFANRGGNIIAFEPVKHLYDLGLKNISINPSLKENIKLFNKAVGAKRGKLNISADSLKDYADESVNYDIEVITINDILEIYNFNPDILKMDCEGCEFDIIETTDLTMFNDIILEHHSYMAGKDPKKLIDTLEKQGFEINIYPCNVSRRDFSDIGIIHAFKKN